MKSVRRPFAVLTVGVIVAALVTITGSTAAAAADPVPGAVTPPGGSYRAITPARVLDTRIGQGAPTGPTRAVSVSTTAAGVPAAGASAVAVNITVVHAGQSGYVTAFSAGAARPGTSNLNYGTGQTVAAMAIVPVDSSGRFTLFASSAVQLLVDVEGYFSTVATASGGALYTPVTPVRLLDTRRTGPALGPGVTRQLQVTGVGGIPAGVTAVVVNTTVVAPTAAGYVTDYAANTPRPPTSTINFAKGQTVANRAIVALSATGSMTLYNNSGATAVVVDVTGYLAVGDAGGYYVPVQPAGSAACQGTATTTERVVNNRPLWSVIGPGYPPLTVPMTGWIPVSFPGYSRGLVPDMTAATRPLAVVVTLTAIPGSAAGSGYLQVHGSGLPQVTSDLNVGGLAPVANLAIATLPASGAITIESSAGGMGVALDLSGYFALPAPNPTPAGIWARSYDGSGTCIHRQTTDLTNVTAIVGSKGGPYDYALTADGRAWRFASQSAGTRLRTAPATQIPNVPTDIVALADGQGFFDGSVYALTASGQVWEWGDFQQPGGGTQFDAKQIQGLTGVHAIGAAANVGYAILNDGTAWAWGADNKGQLGNGTTSSTPITTPVQVAGLSQVVSIVGGYHDNYAIDASGDLYQWGLGGILAPQKVATVCSGTGGTVYPRGTSLGAAVLCPDGTVWQFIRPAMTFVLTQILEIPAMTALAGGSRGMQGLDSAGRVWQLPVSAAPAMKSDLYGIRAIGTTVFVDLAAS